MVWSQHLQRQSDFHSLRHHHGGPMSRHYCFEPYMGRRWVRIALICLELNPGEQVWVSLQWLQSLEAFCCLKPVGDSAYGTRLGECCTGRPCICMCWSQICTGWIFVHNRFCSLKTGNAIETYGLKIAGAAIDSALFHIMGVCDRLDTLLTQRHLLQLLMLRRSAHAKR